MGRELEFKYALTASAFAALQERFGPLAETAMETTYYDTFDLKLAMHHWTLRRRLENGVSVCTFKSPLDDGSRGEWEVEAPSIYDGILKLCQAGATYELMRATAGGVMPTCGARFTRLSRLLALSACTVELALDRGVLTGKGREEPLLELEVEYKTGSEAAAAAFAEEIAAEFSLEKEPLSKFARAMRMCL